MRFHERALSITIVSAAAPCLAGGTNPMTRITLDATITDRLRQGGEVLEVCDETGQTVGYFHPVDGQSPSVRAKQSPFSNEEIIARSQQRTGRSLKEILQELERL
jgi:hypothetical protein